MTRDLGKVWAERMTKAERDQTFPDSEPRDAATVMLIDRSGRKAESAARPPPRGPQIHAGQVRVPGRAHRAARRQDVGDQRTRSRHGKKLNARVANPSREFARALALTAVRETAEETGLLLGVKRDEPPATPGEIWAEFAKARVHPDLGNVHLIARAITPPRRPRRFDARFFTADASKIAHKIDGVVGPDSELVELIWVPIEEATHFDMPTITGVVLEELANRVAAGMGHDLPVPFYFMIEKQFFRELL